jgi:hypothetical protein
VAALEHKPTKVLSSASRLLASENDVAGRHRWARGQKIDARERRALQPVCGIEPAHQPDQGNLSSGELQRVASEFIAEMERWIADEVFDAAIAAQEIELSVEVFVSTISDIGGNGSISGTTGCFRNPTETASTIYYGANERLEG